MKFPDIGEYVRPIVEMRERSATEVKRVVGSAFFLDERGLFMTAAHVMRDLEAVDGGLVLRIGESFKYRQPAQWEVHPKADVALGRIDAATRPMIDAVTTELYSGTEIYGFGFPDHLCRQEGFMFSAAVRQYTGHVQRIIYREEAFTTPMQGMNTTGVELSWHSPRCTSGGPVLAAVGTKTALLAIHCCNVTYGEEEPVRYGAAAAIKDVMDWSPDILDGLPLRSLWAHHFNPPPA